MTINNATFRANFPEFTDPAKYPDTALTFWLGTAYIRLPANVWNELLDLGAQLYAAHNIVLEYQAFKAGVNGGAPGANSGPISSKSASKLSIGYDTGLGAIEGGGNYNLTTYGTRFLELVDIVGVVGITQIGTGYYPLTADGLFGWPYGPLSFNNGVIL